MVTIGQIASFLSVLSFILKFYKKFERSKYEKSDIEELSEYIDTSEERRKIGKFLHRLPYMKTFLSSGDEWHVFITSILVAIVVKSLVSMIIAVPLALIIGLILTFLMSDKKDLREYQYGIGGAILGLIIVKVISYGI